MPTDLIDVQNNIFLHMYIIVHTYIIAFFTVYAYYIYTCIVNTQYINIFSTRILIEVKWSDDEW